MLNGENSRLEEVIKKKNSLNVRRHDQKYQKRIYAEYTQISESIAKHLFEKNNLEEKKKYY